MPGATDQLVAVIRALDDTWHRPFTTLELAALQSLVDPEEFLELDGLSDSAWRERIGNAVPRDAAAAIAGVMGRTLLLAATGQTFMLRQYADMGSAGCHRTVGYGADAVTATASKKPKLLEAGHPDNFQTPAPAREWLFTASANRLDDLERT